MPHSRLLAAQNLQSGRRVRNVPRGGGYSGRTLAGLAPRPLAIGVGLDIQRSDTIRPMPHDIRLDAIMTETTTCGEPDST